MKRSTLADANEQRPAVIFERTYYKLYERVSGELASQAQEAPNIKIIDSTTIDLCASVFPWAKFRTREGAIKLHTVLTGMLPQFVLVTDDEIDDRCAVQDLRFEPDNLLIFDRAYLDFVWLYQLHQGGVWFVTRLKTNSRYEVVRTETSSGPVLAAQLIRLSSPQGQACYPELLRRVPYLDLETDKEYVSLTIWTNSKMLTNCRSFSVNGRSQHSSRRGIKFCCKVPVSHDTASLSFIGASQGYGFSLKITLAQERR